MVKEDYVTKEIMQLLLEKGCPLDNVLVQDFRPVWYTKDYDDPAWQNCDAYYIPTQSQVMRWLREVYRIEIHIVLEELKSDNSRTYQYDIFSSDVNNDFKSIQGHGFNSFEKAGEAAIKYVLENLI